MNREVSSAILGIPRTKGALTPVDFLRSGVRSGRQNLQKFLLYTAGHVKGDLLVHWAAAQI